MMPGRPGSSGRVRSEIRSRSIRVDQDDDPTALVHDKEGSASLCDGGGYIDHQVRLTSVEMKGVLAIWIAGIVVDPERGRPVRTLNESSPPVLSCVKLDPPALMCRQNALDLAATRKPAFVRETKAGIATLSIAPILRLQFAR